MSEDLEFIGYRVVSSHAEDLADGRVFGTGELIPPSLDTSDPHNARLLSEGKIVEVRQPKEKAPVVSDAAKKRASELDVNIAEVVGGGKDGAVRVEDIDAFVESKEKSE